MFEKNNSINELSAGIGIGDNVLKKLGLTKKEVLKIRKLWAEGKRYKYINKNFNINGTTVQRIIAGKIWKNI